MVSDYRGYGASGGSPTLGAISRNCHVIFKAVKEEISKRRVMGGLWVMGRSLGSISATELACRWKNEFSALIIESGFVSVLPLMERVGLSFQMNHAADRIIEKALAKVHDITLPVLIIHGEEDTPVPVEEAKRFYDNLGSAEKKLLIVPGADHNDICLSARISISTP